MIFHFSSMPSTSSRKRALPLPLEFLRESPQKAHTVSCSDKMIDSHHIACHYKLQIKKGLLLNDISIKSGYPLQINENELRELGEGLTSSAYIVDWYGNGGRDLLYTAGGHEGGVFVYLEARDSDANPPVYKQAFRLVGISGRYAIPLPLAAGGAI